MALFIITSTQIYSNVSVTVVNPLTGETTSKLYYDTDNDTVLYDMIVDYYNLIPKDGIYKNGDVEIVIVEAESIDLP